MRDEFDTLSAEEQAKRIERVATVHDSRPKLPAWPTVQGVLGFALSPGFRGRAFTLAGFLSVACVMVVYALSIMFMATSMSTAGYTILGMSIGMMGCVIAAATLLAASAIAFTIVTDSSTGASEVVDWPTTNVPDWFGEGFYMLIAVMAAGLPGGISGYFATNYWVPLLSTPVSIWLFLPLTVLSQLEGASPMAVVMPNVVARVPATLRDWLAMYLLSAALFAPAGGLLIGLASLEPYAMALATPPLVFASLLYFRMIGRLGWALAERK